MKNHYFLAPSLPALNVDEKPDITFKELMERLSLNLKKDELEKVAVLRRLSDLYNIRALYLKQPLDWQGNLNEKELDEALLLQADLPDYVFEFLNQFEGTQDKVRHFFGLISRYYSEEIATHKGFLKDLLILQREMRLVLAALRAKKAKRDIVKELQFEDFTDPIVAHILAQKDMDTYDPPYEYLDLKARIEACDDDPWLLNRAVLLYEYEKIEERAGYPLFSLNWILGYVARFMLIEHLHALDAEKGKEIVTHYKIG